MFLTWGTPKIHNGWQRPYPEKSLSLNIGMLIYHFVAFNTDHSLQKKLCSKNESISSYLTKACVILHSTMADLVVPIPVRNGSVPKIIGLHL